MATCGIYRIQNKINGKIYIGKSVDIKRRWSSHITDSNVDDERWNSNYRGVKTPIHAAIRKYGKENFVFEILEECNKEELNDKEKYWIKTLNATNKENGYNITLGGDGYCCGGGENAPGCKITKAESDLIKQKLKQRWTVKQIQEVVPAATYGIVSAINYGKTWFDENEVYPISIDNGHRTWSDEEAMAIKYRYANGEAIMDLAREFHVTQETISSLVKGKTYTNLPVIKRKVDWARGKSLKRKFSDEEVKIFRQLVRDGESIKSVHESCGISCNYSAFYNMIKRKTYKSVL